MEHPENMRKWYAEKFNTYVHLVRWWDELQPYQQKQAEAQFSNHNMPDYVYELASHGNVIARRQRTRRAAVQS